MAILPENLGSYRQIPSQRWLGYEFYGYSDPLVKWVAAHAETVRRSRNDTKPLAIDVGGASGFKALSLARKGHDVKIIDGDTTIQEAVKTRNEILRREGDSKGSMELHVADVRTLKPKDIEEVCDGRKPSVVTSYLLLHFLKKEELNGFFELFAKTAVNDALLGVSYQRPSRWSNGFNNDLIYHSPDKVQQAAGDAGFKLIKLFPEMREQYGVTRQAFRLQR